MTSAGTDIEQRAIILVPFPFSDLSSSKKRPALVVSNAVFNKKNEDIVCCLITSNPEARNAVKITNKDMEIGFLEFESMVKPYRLFTVSKSIIYKILGRLSIEKSHVVVAEIEKLVKVK